MSRVLALKDYHSLINLQPAPRRSVDKNISYPEMIRQLVQYFHGSSNSFSHYSIEEQRAFIRHVLTIRDPGQEQHRYSEDIYNLIDQMLIYEGDYMKNLTKAIEIPIQFEKLPKIRVWRGDINTLVIDAIVNAANSGLLGCFQPTHLCIDNVIHAGAGPRLRDDCYKIMIKQQEPEPVGHAKITLAYNLPSKYVLHTVGPRLNPGSYVTERDIQQLASCYEACLNLATQMNTITSIAFCSISTGLFSFPAGHACHIAIDTVIKWLRQRGSDTNLSLIVFDVFSLEDEQRYLHALKKFL